MEVERWTPVFIAVPIDPITGYWMGEPVTIFVDNERGAFDIIEKQWPDLSEYEFYIYECNLSDGSKNVARRRNNMADDFVAKFGGSSAGINA